MMTLLSSLVGFFGSMFPTVLDMLKAKSDKKHELKLAELGLLKAENERSASERKAAYELAFDSGSKFIDALSASVRPVISYGFFLLYACIKTFMFMRIYQHNNDAYIALTEIWTQEDWEIFVIILSFWFGYRSLRKMKGV